ncbi:MAG TPA: SRPBCC family protein [Ktedonobacterales bacterium]|nr:SRPBCC family protein [Ktedonobacterales bacterium]
MSTDRGDGPTDRIEKTVALRAPRPRVWRALTQADQFSAWFGIALEGTFAPGARLMGSLTSAGNERVTLEIVVERVEPEYLFSYRWHPYPMEPGVDYAAEPMTLVEFHLSDIADGTQLTVVESGFDRLSPPRRVTAFRMNEQGWAKQLTHIAEYVTT